MTTVIALLASLSVVLIAAEDLCPVDYIIVRRVGTIEETHEGLPIIITRQSGAFVEFAVQNAWAESRSLAQVFTAYETDAFGSKTCQLDDGLEFGGASSTVMHAACSLINSKSIVRIFVRNGTRGEEVATSDDRGATIPTCCHDPNEVASASRVVEYVAILNCHATCEDPIEYSGSSSVTGVQVPPFISLQERILKDMMPPISSQCTRSDTTTSSTFEFTPSQETSHWNPNFAPYEEDLFLAKMSHKHATNPDQEWTIRLGQAGNIYSLVGPMGETVPPQNHDNAPWVDEGMLEMDVCCFLVDSGHQALTRCPFLTLSLAERCPTWQWW